MLHVFFICFLYDRLWFGMVPRKSLQVLRKFPASSPQFPHGLPASPRKFPASGCPIYEQNNVRSIVSYTTINNKYKNMNNEADSFTTHKTHVKHNNTFNTCRNSAEIVEALVFVVKSLNHIVKCMK